MKRIGRHLESWVIIITGYTYIQYKNQCFLLNSIYIRVDKCYEMTKQKIATNYKCHIYIYIYIRRRKEKKIYFADTRYSCKPRYRIFFKYNNKTNHEETILTTTHSRYECSNERERDESPNYMQITLLTVN